MEISRLKFKNFRLNVTYQLYHMSNSKSNNKNTRTRNFASILYPESASPNWLEILKEQHIPFLVSPLHNNDLNPTGDAKKPHYHIILIFDNVKTVEQATEIFKLINSVGCEKINSLKNYSRYLCHLDNPEKAQYKTEDVIAYGIDYLDIIKSTSNKYKMLEEMQDFCDKYDVVSFYLLCQYARKNNKEWYKTLCDNGSVYMREYLKSKDWSMKNGHNVIIDKETGEVIE